MKSRMRENGRRSRRTPVKEGKGEGGINKTMIEMKKEIK